MTKAAAETPNDAVKAHLDRLGVAYDWLDIDPTHVPIRLGSPVVADDGAEVRSSTENRSG